MGEITIDGVKYYQPECHCGTSGHICYLRPAPITINLPISKIISVTNNIKKGGKK